MIRPPLPSRKISRERLEELLLPWAIAFCYIALGAFFWWLDHGQ